MTNIVKDAREYVALNGDDAYHHVSCNVITELADEVERLRELIGKERIECARIAASFANEFDDETCWAVEKAIRERPIVTY